MVIVLLVARDSLFLYLNKPASITNDLYGCNRDNDCISVKSGCCGCTAGGSSTTVNKDYLDYWDKKLLDECKEVNCPAVMSNDWTWFAEPKCAEGRC